MRFCYSGCTEIPLIVLPGDSSLPILDSTRILARAALEYSAAVSKMIFSKKGKASDNSFDLSAYSIFITMDIYLRKLIAGVKIKSLILNIVFRTAER